MAFEGKIKDYRDLLVWQKGIDLAKAIYTMTRTFPAEGKYGIISQMRRAAVSISSNIAEGQARNTTGEFVQFLSHAEVSLAELDTQLRISSELGFLAEDQEKPVQLRIVELQKMLRSLRAKLATQH
ncbi:MAG: four helix bundle protein [Limisphaerales bacterium]